MLLGYIWLLGTFVNSSYDIKINVNIVQNCCRNLAVRGLTAKVSNSHPQKSFRGLLCVNQRKVLEVYVVSTIEF